MMARSLRFDFGIMSLLRNRIDRKRTMVVGLKSDGLSREMLLRLLDRVAKPGDNVLAIHVQEPDDDFDPNTFHIHEDLCKKQRIDFQVKVCVGDSCFCELTNQVRANYATVLILGSCISGPKDSVISTYLKGLPPTCTLMVMDYGGRVLIQRQGTSQQGSSPLLSSSKHTFFDDQTTTLNKLTKSFPITPRLTLQFQQNAEDYSLKKTVPISGYLMEKLFWRLTDLELERSSKRFTMQELCCATNNFSTELVIEEGGHSKVYRAVLDDGRPAAVKVLKATHSSAEDLYREVDILSGIEHENIVQVIGYCDCEEMHAIVYNLLKESLKQKLRQLTWNERMGVAIGLARALEYLHHCCDPPVIHRDVKSSNILLSDNFQPQLSDFGAAMIHNQFQQIPTSAINPINVVGTFGYLAPEYVMYGKLDEKIDVYSYGVVVLQLITGKEALETKDTNHESSVLWARSLLRSGLNEGLIDPSLNEDYNRKDMEMMMSITRLCLMHSSSRRPTMEMILRLFEEPDYWVQMDSEKNMILNMISSKSQIGLWRHDDSVADEVLVMDDI